MSDAEVIQNSVAHQEEIPQIAQPELAQAPVEVKEAKEPETKPVEMKKEAEPEPEKEKMVEIVPEKHNSSANLPAVKPVEKTAPPKEFHKDYFDGLAKKIGASDLQEANKITKGKENVTSGKIIKETIPMSDKPADFAHLVAKTQLDDYSDKANLKQYFQDLAQKLGPSTKEEANTIIEAVNISYKDAISQKKLELGTTIETLDDMVKKLGRKPTVIEEEKKQSQLREIMRKKRELQEKLNHVESNIGQLKIEQNYTSGGEEPKALRDSAGAVNTDFVKKLAKERKELEEKRLARLKMREDKFLAMEEEELKRREEEKKARSDAKKAEAAKQVAELKQRNAKWKEDMKKWEEVYEKKIAELPRFQPERVLKAPNGKASESYMIDELEEKKRELAKKRDIHKPIDISSINDHETRYMENLELRRRKKEEDLRKAHQMIVSAGNKPDYESRFHKIYEDEVKRVKEGEKDKLIKAKELLDKRLRYAEMVKEEYYPDIDEDKRMEIKTKVSMENVRHVFKPRKQRSLSGGKEDENVVSPERETPTILNPREIGNKYLAEVREKAKRRVQTQVATDGAPSESIKSPNRTGAAMSQINGPVSQIGERPKKSKLMLSGEIERQAPKTATTVTNTLAAARSKPDLRKREHKDDWLQIATNQEMSEKDKRVLIKIQAEKLEEAARQKEKVLKYARTDEEQTDELDNLYISSIKAKLALLQDDPLDKQFQGKSRTKKTLKNNETHLHEEN